jgi:uncharacterized protein (TIRG00374 family)
MPEAPRSRKFATAAAKILLGAVLLFLLWKRGLVDPVRLGRSVHAHLDLCLVAFVCQGAILVLMGIRWRLLSRSAGIGLTWTESVRLTVMALSLSTCLPGNAAGDLAKGWILSRRGVPFARTLGTVAIDRWTGIAGLFLSWALWSAVLFAVAPEVRPLAAVLLLVSVPAAGAFVASSLWGAALERHLPAPRSDTGLVDRFLRAVRDILETAARSGTDRRTVLAALALSLGNQVLMVAIGWCAVRTVDVAATIPQIGALLPATMCANALPLAPGGVGLGETVGALGFSRLGLPAWTGSETLLLVRLASVSWAVPGILLWILDRPRR